MADLVKHPRELENVLKCQCPFTGKINDLLQKRYLTRHTIHYINYLVDRHSPHIWVYMWLYYVRMFLIFTVYVQCIFGTYLFFNIKKF